MKRAIPVFLITLAGVTAPAHRVRAQPAEQPLEPAAPPAAPAPAAPPPDSAGESAVPAPAPPEPAVAPDDAPAAGATRPADSDATPPVAPEQPSPAQVFLQSQRDAAARRESEHTDLGADEPDDGSLGRHQDHWGALLGIRAGKITSAGYDPFATSDELAQLTLGAGGTFLHTGSLSLAGLFLWDVGGRSADARGAEADLTVHRLTIGLEGRYHFFRQLFAFARVAPGAIHSIAAIDDRGVGDGLEARQWVFATDLSLGAMLELSGFTKEPSTRRPSAWIGLDGGYGFAGESDLSMTSSGGPERSQPVELGALALSGPFLRASLGVSY